MNVDKQSVMKVISAIGVLLNNKRLVLAQMSAPIIDEEVYTKLSYVLRNILIELREQSAVHIELAKIYHAQFSNTGKRLDKMYEYRLDNEFFITLEESAFLNELIALMEALLVDSTRVGGSDYVAVVQKPPKTLNQKIADKRVSEEINNKKPKKAS